MDREFECMVYDEANSDFCFLNCILHVIIKDGSVTTPLCFVGLLPGLIYRKQGILELVIKHMHL